MRDKTGHFCQKMVNSTIQITVITIVVIDSSLISFLVFQCQTDPQASCQSPS